MRLMLSSVLPALQVGEHAGDDDGNGTRAMVKVLQLNPTMGFVLVAEFKVEERD